MEQQLMTRRQRRILKREARQKVAQTSVASGQAYKGYIIGAVIVVGVILVVGYRLRGRSSPASSNATLAESTGTYTAEPVHWHAAFEVDLCGVKQDFSSYGGSDHHAGLPLLHTHGDGVIHLEGRVIAKEDIALGRFFDAINIPFDRDKIMSKKNGDECIKGKPGSVKMFVNNKPSDEFRNYIPLSTANAQEDRIKIVFE